MTFLIIEKLKNNPTNIKVSKIKNLKHLKSQVRRPEIKKSSDILYLELKNITKDIFKISKTQKLPTRTKNLNNYESHVRRPQIKKNQDVNYCQN